MSDSIVQLQPLGPPGADGVSLWQIIVHSSESIVERWSLEVMGELGPFATITPPTVAVMPGTTASASLRLAPPRSPEVSAGLVPFAVRATAEASPDHTIVTEAEAMVPPLFELSARMRPRSARAFRKSKRIVTVANEGNSEVQARLEVDDGADVLDFRLSRDQVLIPPGQEAETRLIVKSTESGKGQRPFKLTVNSAEKNPIVINGVFRQRSLIPVIAGAAAIVVGAVAVGVLAANHKPSNTAVLDTSATTAGSSASPGVGRPAGASKGKSVGKSGGAAHPSGGSPSIGAAGRSTGVLGGPGPGVVVQNSSQSGSGNSGTPSEARSGGTTAASPGGSKRGTTTPTSAETTVRSTYESGLLGLNPYGYWRLGEALSSLPAIDSSASGFNGAYNSCVKTGQPGGLANDTATSDYFGQTSSTGCWMTYKPQASYTGSYTVEAWVKPSGTTQSGQTFLDSRAPDPKTWLQGEFGFDLKLQGVTGSNGNNARTMVAADIGDGHQFLLNISFPYQWQANQWYFIAMVVGTSSATFYVDGVSVKVASYSAGNPLLWDANHPLCIGGNARYPTGENFNGDIQDAAVFTYPLTGVEIQQQWTAGTT